MALYDALYEAERRELVDAHSATNLFLSPPPTDTKRGISARFQRNMSLVGFNSKYGLSPLEDKDVCRVDNTMPCGLITRVDAIYQHDNGTYHAQLLTYSLQFSELFGVKLPFLQLFKSEAM